MISLHSGTGPFVATFTDLELNNVVTFSVHIYKKNLFLFILGGVSYRGSKQCVASVEDCVHPALAHISSAVVIRSPVQCSHHIYPFLRITATLSRFDASEGCILLQEGLSEPDVHAVQPRGSFRFVPLQMYLYTCNHTALFVLYTCSFICTRATTRLLLFHTSATDASFLALNKPHPKGQYLSLKGGLGPEGSVSRAWLE